MKGIYLGVIILLACLTLNGQVVINEVQVKPGTSTTDPNIQSLKVCTEATFGEEFIELYNPDPCADVDISCYIIATSAWSSKTNGAFRFPSGTTIPPLGHISIGGPNSGATFNMYNYCSDPHLLTGNDRWYLDNGDMYVALYDDIGTPVNAVFWTSNNGESSKWGTDSDLDEAPEYVPTGVSCPSVSSLPFPTSVVEYAGGSPALASSLSRTSDGALTWGVLSPTVNDCNGGTCVTSSPFSVSASVTQPTCGNSDGSITLTPNPTGAYTYTWTPNVSSTNSASGLDANSYTINVDDGSCSWDTTITLNAPAAFSVSATVNQPTCGNTDGSITLNPNPAGSYTYTWTPNVSATNSASNLGNGSYQINIDDGSCSWDTTITLTAPSPFSVSAVVNQPTCENTDGNITLTPNPAGSYTYTWTPNVSATNSASNLGDGSYQINVDDGSCSWDTTITLTAPTCDCTDPLVLSVDSTANTLCGGTSNCNYSGPTILINEMGVNPSNGDGSIYGLSPLSSAEGEWIELYNPDWCNSIDISGYIFGSYNSTDGGGTSSITVSNGMGFVIPSGTVVPPQGFVVVRGRNAPVPPASAIDIVMDDLGGNLCIDGGNSTSRIWLQGSGGWFGFYDASGTPQDIVTWGTPNSASDLDGLPCIPSSSSVSSLVSANASGILYDLGPSAPNGQGYVRIPDGGAWSTTTQGENSSYGTCNDLVGGCVIASGDSSTCNGSATVNVISGAAGPYTYQWDDPLNQTTATADSLCPGTYNVTVTDASGDCISSISVEILDESGISFTSQVTQPTCAGNDGTINITPDISGSYTYTWTPNVSTSNSASNLSSGSYTIEASNGTCLWDTTITLNSLAPFTVSANTTDPSCANNDGSINLTPSTPDNYTYTWAPNVSSSNSSTTLASGSYTITVDNGNCNWDTTIILNSATPFTVTPTVVAPTCELNNGSISLATSVPDTYTYTWSPNVSSTSNASNLSSGSYNININNGSCSFDTTITLTNSGINPIANFNYTITDSTCTLAGVTTNLSSGASNFIWYIDNVQYSQNTDITFQFEDDQPHVISLEAVSIEGCRNSTSTTINYQFTDVPLFIPNVFTPQNQDGKNDTWYVIGECIEEFECQIFNRWGNKLYTMTDINNRWDGTYNGKKVPQGVYVYIIRVKKSFSPRITKHGHITKL